MPLRGDRTILLPVMEQAVLTLLTRQGTTRHLTKKSKKNEKAMANNPLFPMGTKTACNDAAVWGLILLLTSLETMINKRGIHFMMKRQCASNCPWMQNAVFGLKLLLQHRHVLSSKTYETDKPPPGQ